MSVRPMFNNRGAQAKPKGKRRVSKKPPKMRVVARDGKTVAPRRTNPDDQTIPWKTIVVTTLVTSMISTVGVTVARIFIDRARDRRFLQGLQAQEQAKAEREAAEAEAAFQPNPAEHRAPPMFDAPPRGIPQHPPRRSMEVVNMPQSLGGGASFDPNPFAPSQVRQLPLPEAPHVPRSASEEEPGWFKAFRRDYEQLRRDVYGNPGHGEHEEDRY